MPRGELDPMTHPEGWPARRRRVHFIALAALSAISCSSEPEAPPYAWSLPPGFPEPAVPADNPMSEAKVELGRFLFYDKRLSANQSMACATCHEQKKAFTDGKVTPVGSTGDSLARNAMGLANVAYLSTLTWANPLLPTLEEQALVPMFGELPVELGMTGHTEEILDRFRADSAYPAMFAAAFPDEADPIRVDTAVKAIASFERTLISGDSAYDRYFYRGDEAAISPSAQRGLDLFFSEKLECYHCHSGVSFTTSFRSKETALAELDFHNTGLYNIGGDGSYPPDNTGLYEFTQNPSDTGKFRVSGLRNIELTAPYMHDGSVATLEGAIDHYAAGGRTLMTGPHAGVGSESPFKSPLVRPFTLTTEERDDVVAFLRSLTDTSFVNDSRFGDPFEPAP